MTPMFKAGLLATTMAAVGLVPAAGVITVLTADAAYAKGGGNGNGGGNGGERGNGGRDSEARGGPGSEARGGPGRGPASGRPDWAGSRESGGKGGSGRSESARGGSDPVSNFIRGLTGQEKREARTQARSTRPAVTERAPKVSAAPSMRPARSTDMHASELGNMNAAFNANMNAVLAHIRNGNTNGPIGQMAALAVASAAAEEAFAELAPEDVATYGDLQDKLEKAGFDSLAEYIAAGEAEKVEEIETALADPAFDQETYDKYFAAREQADAILSPAQESILAYWNKNPDTMPEIDPEREEPLLDALMSRFEGYEEQIDAAIAEAETRAASEAEEEAEPEDLDAACEDETACAPSEDVELAATE